MARRMVVRLLMELRDVDRHPTWMPTGVYRTVNGAKDALTASSEPVEWDYTPNDGPSIPDWNGYVRGQHVLRIVAFELQR